MNNNVSVDRTFALRQYENLKVSESFTDIPFELSLDKNFMSQLKYLILLDIELVKERYELLLQRMKALNPDVDLIKWLQEEKTKTLQEVEKTYSIIIKENH